MQRIPASLASLAAARGVVRQDKIWRDSKELKRRPRRVLELQVDLLVLWIERRHSPAMLRLLVAALVALFRPRAHLMAENIALRQQLAVFKMRTPRRVD